VARHNLNEMKDNDDNTKAFRKKIKQMLLNGPNSDFSGKLVANIPARFKPFFFFVPV